MQPLAFSSIDRLVIAGIYALAPDILDARKIVKNLLALVSKGLQRGANSPVPMQRRADPARRPARTVTFNNQSVFRDYSAVTGFNPNDPTTDQGPRCSSTGTLAPAKFFRHACTVDWYVLRQIAPPQPTQKPAIRQGACGD